MMRPTRSSLATPLLMAISIVAGVMAVAATSSPSAGSAVEPQPVVTLRMEEVGGFAPFQALLLRVPAFTLYDDGLIVYRPEAVGGPEDITPPMRVATLSPSQVGLLMDAALDRVGGLRDARSEYAVGGIADATTTVFTVNAEDVAKSVSVYGLGFGDEGPDRQAIRRFEALATMLADPSSWLPQGTEVSDYEPFAYRGVFTADDPEGTDLRPWPWDDLAPADLLPVKDATAIGQADLTPEQAALVATVPNGGAFDIAIAAPDGNAAWRLALRPLLPDEDWLDQSAAEATPAPTSPADDEYDYGY